MATLADATLALARNLMAVFEGTVDASPAPAATGFTDLDLSRRKRELFTFGTIWMLTGTHAGKSRIVTAHAESQLEFDTLGSAPAAGDRYAVAPGRHEQYALIAAVNKALQALGEMAQWDVTLTVVGLQEEYTLPVGVTHVQTVETARFAADPRGWRESRHWDEIAGNKIRFLSGWEPGVTGDAIRLGYNAPHAQLTADTAAVDPGVNLERLSWEAAIALNRQFLEEHRSLAADDPTPQLANEARDMLKKAPRHSLRRLKKRLTLGGL